MRSSVRRMVPPLQTSILCRDRIAGILWRGDSLDHSPAHALRFGDFELDVRAGELRQGERRIRLQEQPFQILLMLLEHPGEVLYEMAWSQQAFAGATSVEIREAILSREVSPPQRLNPAIHPRLQTIIEKALEKDRAVRYQHASDLRADLKRLQRQIQSDRPAGVTTSPQGGSNYPQAQGSARRGLFQENVRGPIKYPA